jgi:predicted nucleic acid-binding protein
MGTDAPHILIVDSSVLINFLRIDRADLLARSGAQILVTEHVVAEVTEDYPDQLVRLNSALAQNLLRVVSITDVNELKSIAELRQKTEARLGIGECSAIVVAHHRACHIAIDDGAAIRQIKKTYPSVTIHKTVDLMVRLIQDGALSVEDADSIREDWRNNHSFTIRLNSFGELL